TNTSELKTAGRGTHGIKPRLQHLGTAADCQPPSAFVASSRSLPRITRMKPGFYTIMAAQFFSSLADNALLIAAIALLHERLAPYWMTPMLKLFFTFSYVALAAFAGAFGDLLPKGSVMFVTNTIKFFG